MEIWKPINGFDGAYEVSSFGRIRSVERTVPHRFGTAVMKGRILSLAVNNAGYMYVSLSKECKGRSFLVHRLVAKHFLGDRDNGEVNHKDFNKSNNNVSNLEWTERKGNHAHAMAGSRFNPTKNETFARKLRLAQVEEIRRLRAEGVRALDLARKYAINVSTVYSICRFRSWKLT